MLAGLARSTFFCSGKRRNPEKYRQAANKEQAGVFYQKLNSDEMKAFSKNCFLLSGFILCFSFTAKAQEIDLGKLQVGGFVGTNLSTYSMESALPETSSRFGYQFGAYLRYGERFFLQSGLSWYRVSARLSVPVLGGDRVGVNLIQLPLMGGVHVWEQEDKDRSFRIQAGPALSVLTGVNENDLGFSGGDFSNIWPGILLGAGMDVWIFTLDAGYQWGLGDSFSGGVAEGSYRMATFSLGVRL